MSKMTRAEKAEELMAKAFEFLPKRPSGFHWQLMGSEAPNWIEGYDQVYAWFLEHAERGGGHWDGLIAGAHEAIDLLSPDIEMKKILETESNLKLDFNLRLNLGKSTIAIIHEKKESRPFEGHEGRIMFHEIGKDVKIAERPFFVIMEGEKVITVALRAQIL